MSIRTALPSNKSSNTTKLDRRTHFEVTVSGNKIPLRKVFKDRESNERLARRMQWFLRSIYAVTPYSTKLLYCQQLLRELTTLSNLSYQEIHLKYKHQVNLCYLVGHRLPLDKYTRYYSSSLLADLTLYWPKRSESGTYPVPSADPKLSAEAYYSEIREYNNYNHREYCYQMWSTRQPYGKARRELLDFYIKVLNRIIIPILESHRGDIND